MESIKIKAYAKINLILDVLKKRPDGYHEVAMIMQAISLHDVIAIKPGKGITVRANDPLVPLDERNLAYKAAEMVIQRYPQVDGVEINIEKNIPVEAGLAGGSTDGAAVIVGMDRLFKLNMDLEEMLELGALLGSDVPFCISGVTALAKGRGEIIEKAPLCPRLWVVLVKPPFGVKTAQVYKNLNLDEAIKHPQIDKYLEALAKGDVSYLVNNIENVLEYSTFKLYPEVRDLKESLVAKGAQKALMSGSGPTVFALFKCLDEARSFADKLKKEGENKVLLAYTLNEQEFKERVKHYG
ncbi:MAG: 4-(cytidine 5'-diphospho)-2-C-methyl-D-erythritol kinase [Clostridia bacterium]|nr:4-(cytidine 5'-diphospho)-2-C-methyl-D-erythritol kinase [Clostridia bacterium]